MERAARLCRAVCIGVVAFDLSFVFPNLFPARVLWYEPIAHRWSFALRPESLGVDWFGRTLLAMVGGTVAFMVALALRRLRAGSQSLVLWTSWAGIATALTVALQLFQLITRHPVPEPLPTWYVPR